MLAIRLLNNYNLSDETISNANMQLVEMAKAKQVTSNDATVKLSPHSMSQIKKVASNLKTLSQSSLFKFQSSDLPPVLRGKPQIGNEKIS